MKMFKWYIENGVDKSYEKEFACRGEVTAWVVENLDYKNYDWEYGQIHPLGLYKCGTIRYEIDDQGVGVIRNN